MTLHIHLETLGTVLSRYGSPTCGLEQCGLAYKFCLGIIREDIHTISRTCTCTKSYAFGLSLTHLSAISRSHSRPTFSCISNLILIATAMHMKLNTCTCISYVDIHATSTVRIHMQAFPQSFFFSQP